MNVCKTAPRPPARLTHGASPLFSPRFSHSPLPPRQPPPAPQVSRTGVGAPLVDCIKYSDTLCVQDYLHNARQRNCYGLQLLLLVVSWLCRAAPSPCRAALEYTTSRGAWDPSASRGTAARRGARGAGRGRAGPSRVPRPASRATVCFRRDSFHLL
ncbi:hypothetical protein E2C01_033422 [Portunus trituberculatus]|uniref:Uncharacterized protein n=1 Tax=Portunus trituberculatus TaxID=210409 RepID=A0A5B7EYM9_PORTR|nr:hypothetical protein [Portunus trituberculatus]